MTRVGMRLRQLREARGLSQEALGELVGVRGATISRYESGKAEIGVSFLPELARALVVPPSALTEEQPAPLPEPYERLVAKLTERFERRLDEELAPIYEALDRRPTEPQRTGRALSAEEVEELGTEYLAREFSRSLLGLPDEEFGHLMNRALTTRAE